MIPRLRFCNFKDPYSEGCITQLIESLDSGASVNSHDYPVQNSNDVGVLKTSCIFNGEFFPLENKQILSDEVCRAKNPICSGSLIISRMNTPALVGEVGYVERNYPNLFVPDRLWILKTKENVSSKWLNYCLTSPKNSASVKSLASGTSGTMKNISMSSFLKVHLQYPDFGEQQKIADFLSSVDKKISQLKEKHALLQQYKKGVMQQIFTQQIRFKDDKGKAFADWKVEPLGKQLQEYKAKSQTEREYEVFTSARTGLMKQSDYYSEGRITERDNEGFNIIPEGYMTYRSRSDDRQFYFNANTLGMTGIISTYYPVFKMINEQTDFFLELTRYYKNTFGRYAVGTSQVVLSFNELAKIKLQIPCAEEQKRIGDFAKVIDTKINLVAEQIEQTQQFKKGLLQQMFV